MMVRTIKSKGSMEEAAFSGTEKSGQNHLNCDTGSEKELVREGDSVAVEDKAVANLREEESPPNTELKDSSGQATDDASGKSEPSGLSEEPTSNKEGGEPSGPPEEPTSNKEADSQLLQHAVETIPDGMDPREWKLRLRKERRALRKEQAM